MILHNRLKSLRVSTVMPFACTIHFECKSKAQPCCECIVIGSRVTNPIIVFPACDLHQHFFSTCLKDPRRHQAQCFALPVPWNTRGIFIATRGGTAT